MILLAAILFCIYIFFHLYYFSKIIFSTTDISFPETENPISIIICAHNEAENLKENLPYFLNQYYSKYELVVVNDASNDDTASVLSEFEKLYDCLKIVTINEKNEKIKGKKFALQQGIAAAKNPYIALSDADCKPIHQHWLKHINAHLQHNNIVIGISPYINKNTNLSRFINYETLHTAILYISFALQNKAYMSVGRNVAYKSEILKKADWASLAQIPSGDDDLLFQQLSEGEKIDVMMHPESFVFSKPACDWKAYLNQKARHLSAGKYYKNKYKFILGLYATVQSLLYITLIILLFYSLKPALILLLASIYIHVRVYKFIALRWQWHVSIFEIIYFEIAFIAFYIIFSPVIFIKNKMQWK